MIPDEIVLSSGQVKMLVVGFLLVVITLMTMQRELRELDWENYLLRKRLWEVRQNETEQ